MGYGGGPAMRQCSIASSIWTRKRDPSPPVVILPWDKPTAASRRPRSPILPKLADSTNTFRRWGILSFARSLPMPAFL